MCYTYDDLSRVTSRVIKSLADNSVISTENYTYDAAGNMTDAPDSYFQYDTNNRLVVFNGNNVTYDLDGNMLNDGVCSYTYDSANRLRSFGGHTYTYTSADIRIRNLCAEEDTTYTYNTNCKLSQLLTKTTNGVTTKYVYGRGLIGEQAGSTFKTYHFDCRGSTVAITDANGNIIDTFAYDTYGNLASRTGTSKVLFLYNGRDGVITDDNGLYYMRARYYSPEMRRFVNADIVAGQISNAVTLNRFAYANGNPVSFVDPFGLWGFFSDIGNAISKGYNVAKDWVVDTATDVGNAVVDGYNTAKDWVVDTATTVGNAVSDGYNAAKDWTVNTATTVGNAIKNGYNTTKDFVVDTAQTASKWVDDNVVKPVRNAATAVGDWLEDAGEWLNENAKNKDGSYSLYDNQRFNKDAVFHEQILAFTPSGSSFDLRTGNIGFGSLEVDAITGGWEGEYANLSLLDFGHAEAGAEIKNGDIMFGALASVWSPSFSFSIGKLSIEIGAEVGAVGAGFKKVNNGFSLFGAYGFGGSLTFSWND